MTENPIAEALRERMSHPENDTSPTVKDAERDYIASRISLGGQHIRTESTTDGRTVFAIMADPEDVKSYNDLLGEHVRAGLYIGDDNQVSYHDNPLQAGLAYGMLTGQRTEIDIEPCDCPVCKPEPTDPTAG